MAEEETELPPLISSPEEIAEPVEVETDTGLEAIFEIESDQNAPEVDLDGFWGQEEKAAGSGNVNADALSYEQAQQLGLAPNNDE